MAAVLLMASYTFIKLRVDLKKKEMRGEENNGHLMSSLSSEKMLIECTQLIMDQYFSPKNQMVF